MTRKPPQHLHYEPTLRKRLRQNTEQLIQALNVEKIEG